MPGLDFIEEGTRLPSRRELEYVEAVSVENIPTTPDKNKVPTKGDKMTDAICNNFGRILDLAGDIASIQKMKTQSESICRQMAEARKNILAEAEAYAQKRKADTSSVVERMNVIRQFMNDFYLHNDGQMTGEDFCKIITEVVNQMGRVENGLK